MMRQNLVNPDAELFQKNICVICLEEPSTVWSSSCGHLCQCQNCAENNIKFTLENNVPVSCPYCRTQVTKFWTTKKPSKCKLCKKNLALIAHDKCGKLILCQACSNVLLDGCLSCKSSEGNRVELFFPGTPEDPVENKCPDFEEQPYSAEKVISEVDNYTEDTW